MKKTLRYLLMVISLVSVLSINAQSLAQQPNANFRSTSAMAGSGSALPQAAVTGAYMTGNSLGTYTPANPHGNMSGPRKIGGNTGGGSGDREDPYEDPIGDAALPLALLACAYVLFRYVRTRKRA